MHGFVVGLSMVVTLTGCRGEAAGDRPASPPPGTASSTSGTAGTSFPFTTEETAIEAGTYRIPSSAWSVADFTVTFPERWSVQYGHVFHRQANPRDLTSFYAVVVDAIFADACEGDTGELMEIGPGVDDLAKALLRQPGPKAGDPVETMLGGYPASRIDLTLPKGFDLTACSIGDAGLQIWYSPPADKYLVHLPEVTSSLYIVDVDGQRQVFVTQYRPVASGDVPQELQGVLDSIRIEP